MGIERTPKEFVKNYNQLVFTIAILDLHENEVFRIVGKINEVNIKIQHWRNSYSTYDKERLK